MRLRQSFSLRVSRGFTTKVAKRVGIALNVYLYFKNKQALIEVSMRVRRTEFLVLPT